LIRVLPPQSPGGGVTGVLGSDIPARNARTGITLMAEHEHGSMDTSVQEKTFEGFITWSIRVVVASIAILIFLAIFNS